MFLKRLEIQGFKTFSARTVFEFGDGISTIVGPNGSGKSNIADAVRWALGEQNPRAVRCKQANDVIFAGTARRASMGMAEVILTFDNSTGWLPLSFTEVSIGRRAYRSGETDYLLNGVRVRLRDITDLLRQVALEAGGYVVVAQGMVDAILSQKGEERRTLIESAAGLQQYYARRNEAEDRLNATEANLATVSAIIAEGEPALLALEEQAAVARDYTETKAQLHALLASWYAHGHAAAVRASTVAMNAETQAKQAIDDHSAALVSARGVLHDRRLREEAVSQQVEEWRRQVRQYHQQREAAERDLAVARTQLSAHDGRASDIAADIKRLEERCQLVEADNTAAIAAVNLAESDRQARENELHVASAALGAVEKELAEATNTLRRYESVVTAEKQREDEAARLVTMKLNELARAQMEGHTLQGIVERVNSQLSIASAQLVSLREALAKAEQEQNAAVKDEADSQANLDSVNKDALAAQAAYSTLAAELTQATGRRDLLRAWVRDTSTGDHKASQNDVGEPVTVADMLIVPPQWHAAVAATLGYALSAVVLDSLAALHDYVQNDGADSPATTQSKIQDQATVAVIPTYTEPTVAQLRHTLCGLLRSYCPDVSPVWAADVVTARRAGDLVPSLLGTVLLAPDQQTLLTWFDACQSVAVNPDTETHVAIFCQTVVIASADGQVFFPTGVFQHGNTDRWTTLLRYQHELAALEERLPALQEKAEIARSRQQEAAACRQQAAQALATAQSRHQNTRDAVTKRAADVTLHERLCGAALDERARAERMLADNEQLQDRISTAIASAEADLARQRDRVAQARQAAADATQVHTAAQTRKEELRRSRATTHDAAALARTRVADARAAQDRATNNLQRTRRERDEKIAQQTALAQQRDRAQQQTDDATQRYTVAVTAIQNLSAQLAPAQNELSELRREREALETQLARGEGELTALHGTATAAAAAVERAHRDVRALEEAVENDLGCAIVDLQLTEGPPPPASKIKTLRGKLAAYGPVNARALDDYDAALSRLTFLRSQAADLIDGISILRALIDEANLEVRQKFQITIETINKTFQDYFERLFVGGKCSLAATFDHHGMPASVDVLAQPPGKRTHELALLSGGERALVALALLFALLAVRPVPFCLLDEVEAALDEANTTRFMSILRSLVEQTQFLLISHNRGTMVQADALYGITMGESGISQVASLRLAGAEATPY